MAEVGTYSTGVHSREKAFCLLISSSFVTDLRLQIWSLKWVFDTIYSLRQRPSYYLERSLAPPYLYRKNIQFSTQSRLQTRNSFHCQLLEGTTATSSNTGNTNTPLEPSADVNHGEQSMAQSVMQPSGCWLGNQDVKSDLAREERGLLPDQHTSDSQTANRWKVHTRGLLGHCREAVLPCLALSPQSCLPGLAGRGSADLWHPTTSLPVLPSSSLSQSRDGEWKVGLTDQGCMGKDGTGIAWNMGGVISNRKKGMFPDWCEW